MDRTPDRRLQCAQESFAQKAHQQAQVRALAILQPVRLLQRLGHQGLVRRAMLLQDGKAGLGHELFFASEMHARELDEAVEYCTELLTAGSARHSKTQLIHRVHEDAVLIVHGANADSAVVLPGEKSHMSLHESLMEVSVAQRGGPSVISSCP